MRDVLSLGLQLDRKGIRHGLLDQRPVFRNMALFWYLTREPGGLPWAYSKMMDPTAAPLPANPLFLAIANRFDAPFSLWFWKERFDALSSGPEMAPASYESGGGEDWRPNLVFSLLWYDPEARAFGPEESGLPASHQFKRLGLVVARKDHEEDTPVFRLLAGPRYDRRWDAMSISLSAYGQRLIVDPGFFYSKRKGDSGSDLLFHTEAHSAPLLNGKGPEELSRTSWPALIQWHEQDREQGLEYILASAAFRGQGLLTDGSGDLEAAERHALVVHEGDTPFYVVICDLFDYPGELAATNPSLDFVLVASEDSSMEADGNGATITGSKASLRAELVTKAGATTRIAPLREVKMNYFEGTVKDEKGAENPRVIWSRRRSYGRTLTVLTPLRPGMEAPRVELLEDSPERTSCRVRFGAHEDRITFFAPRPEVQAAGALKTGRRMLIERNRPGREARRFSVPSESDRFVEP
jgi:hypothetical protein